MSIVACYVSSEGIVLGADSTTTFFAQSAFGPASHHLNYAQKIFEVGPAGAGTLGVCTWGAGSIGAISHRTIIAEFTDHLSTITIASVVDAASQFAAFVWSRYCQQFAGQINAFRPLDAKGVGRNQAEEAIWRSLRQTCSVNYCLGGTWWKNRTPQAFTVGFEPSLTTAPTPAPHPAGLGFWGVPNFTNRMLNGIDDELLARIISCGKWSGTQQELIALVSQFKLHEPIVFPMREAIDFVFSTIFTTIKALKFSIHPAVCGGPIEIAVITSDRPFRWVRHKALDEAIG